MTNAALDHLAEQFLAQNAPLRFEVVITPPDLEAVYRLRYQEVMERGWGKPEDFPDGMEQDEHDLDAIQIAIWDGAELIGTARLILPVPDQPLPVEAAFDVTIEPRAQVVYLSRIVIAPAYRGKAGHLLMMGLLGKAWQAIRLRGFQHLCGVIAENMIRYFRILGVQVVPLGQPREFWGEKRFACYIDMAETARKLKPPMPD